MFASTNRYKSGSPSIIFTDKFESEKYFSVVVVVVVVEQKCVFRFLANLSENLRRRLLDPECEANGYITRPSCRAKGDSAKNRVHARRLRHLVVAVRIRGILMILQ